MGFLSKLFSFSAKDTNASASGKSQPLRANRNKVTCACYSVKGKNPATGRRKTVSVIVESSTALEEVQKKSGLLPPYEVQSQPCAGPPTDSQIKYAEKIGIAFPADATIRDASIFLTRYERGLPLTPPAAPDKLVRYLVDKGIYVPVYAGAGEMSRIYLYGCSPTERVAFFCMRVYCSISHKKYRFLEDATPNERALFFDFSEAYIGDTGFMRSLDHYSTADLPLTDCPSLKKLKAYDIAAAFLKVKGAV